MLGGGLFEVDGLLVVSDGLLEVVMGDNGPGSSCSEFGLEASWDCSSRVWC